MQRPADFFVVFAMYQSGFGCEPIPENSVGDDEIRELGIKSPVSTKSTQHERKNKMSLCFLEFFR